MRRTKISIFVLGCVLLLTIYLLASEAIDEKAYDIAWSRQLGTDEDDNSWSVATDGAGNALISGQTRGNFDRQSAGDLDAFLAKYDPDGNLLWIVQLGTHADDVSYAVAVDGAGNPFISGQTQGDLGGNNAGGTDAFLAKYDPDGNLLWTVQLGTPADDVSYAVAVDGAGNAFISGQTQGNLGGKNAGGTEAFLARYDPDGNLLWTVQIAASADDSPWSVAVDGAGNPFISGQTRGNLGGKNAGGEDAFLIKFDNNQISVTEEENY
ncbi:MAG: hypothetical protein FVQ79_00815 [Planctomycetes bacterium]|nr:hypothetical protein [Planctomycetota bacterium]